MEKTTNNEPSTEELDLINRSNKKPKRKITHLIFNRQPDEEMVDQNQQRPPGPEPRTSPNANNRLPVVRRSFRDLIIADQLNRSAVNFNETEDEDLSDDDTAPEDVADDPTCPVILLSKEEKKRLRQPWKHALIIKMFDSKIGYMSLMKRLKKKWDLTGGLILTDVGHDYFIARFSNIADYNHVLTQGPWMLDDNYLTIRKWIPNFTADSAPMRFLTAWVRIPHLSVEYFDQEFLKKVGSRIGKVIRIDQNTASAERGQFTRLSIELDLSKPLLSKFWFRGKTWKVQYEGLRMICFACGKIGHSGETCSTNKDMVMQQEETQEPLIQTKDREKSNDNEDQLFGSWMLVKKPPPRKRTPRPEKGQADAGRAMPKQSTQSQNRTVNPNGDRIGGSRFSALIGQNLETNQENNGNKSDGVNLGTDSFVESLEIVDLGKDSQYNHNGTVGNPFNVGISNNQGNNLSKNKHWQVKKKAIISPSNFALQDISNREKIPLPRSFEFPTGDKENTVVYFQANSEANPAKAVTSNISTPSIPPKAKTTTFKH